MSETGLIILAVVNIPLYFLWGKLLFRDWAGFKDAIFFWFKPDIFSLFDGEYWEDMVAEFKLAVWIGLCGFSVFGEAMLISKIFG